MHPPADRTEKTNAMNFNIARQPIVPAFLTFLLLSAAACLAPTPGIVENLPAAQLDRWLGCFEAAHPAWGGLLTFVLLLWSGLLTGRITVRYGLYATSSCVAIPMFGIAAAWVLPATGLAGAVTLLLLALSTHNFCRSFRNGYAFDNIFRGGLYLGLIPLLYLPATPLLLLLPAAVILFKRTLRELSVALTGVLLPLLTACYLNWAAGHPFTKPLLDIVRIFTADNTADIWSMPWTALLLPGFMLLLDAAAAISYLNSVYSVGFKARGILAFASCMLLLATGIALLPCSGPTALLLLTVPTSLLAPFLLVRMHHALSLALYMLLLAGSLAAPYLWPLAATA